MTEDELREYAAGLETEVGEKEAELEQTNALNSELSNQVSELENKVTSGKDVIEVVFSDKTYRVNFQHFKHGGKDYKALDLKKNAPIIGEILEMVGQAIFTEVVVVTAKSKK